MRTGTSFMLALHAAVLLAACGGADPLDKDQVVGIPAGTARGTAASGTYAAHLQVTACSGTCTPRVCEVGRQLDADAAVTQVDGRLTFDAGGVPLAGGIDADGGFVVGGWGALGALEASTLHILRVTSGLSGGVAERSKAAVLKTAERKLRGFESLLLRKADNRIARSSFSFSLAHVGSVRSARWSKERWPSG
jgi:hypothetical protein